MFAIKLVFKLCHTIDQATFQVKSDSVVGLLEEVGGILHDNEVYVRVNIGLYGEHPIYLCYEWVVINLLQIGKEGVQHT